METISIKCPECGANIRTDQSRKRCFCSYCGTEIAFDDGSKTITYRTIDEAHIKESESQTQVKLEEFNVQRAKDKMFIIGGLSLLIVWLISVIVLIVVSLHTHDVVGFSPYQIVLIIDLIFGFKAITSYFKSR